MKNKILKIFAIIGAIIVTLYLIGLIIGIVSGIQKRKNDELNYVPTLQEKNNPVAITVTNPTSGIYKAGQEVIIEAEFTENVYGGENQEVITSETAPDLYIQFGYVSSYSKKMSFKQVNEKKIQYTYTLKDDDVGILVIMGYKGIVYNKDGKSIEVQTRNINGNTITGSGLLVDKVHIGDYVNYDASSGNGTGRNYTTEENSTGSKVATTFSSSDDMKWKVMNIDYESGTITLRADKQTKQELTLSGKKGYMNGEEVLNNIGAVYGYGNGATGGRSLTIDDLDKLNSYKITETAESDTAYDKLNGTKYITGTFLAEDGTEITASIDNTVTMSYTQSTTSKFTNKPITCSVKLLGANSFWLASPCIGIYNDRCYYCFRSVYNGHLSQEYLFETTGPGYANTKSYSVVPVITLKANILTSGRDNENNAWDLIIE
ncbi:MAG: hypothetical protein J6A89_03250 [Clostridia bacterium]|nr:hypothetical protein [Clostridia bacterium]